VRDESIIYVDFDRKQLAALFKAMNRWLGVKYARRSAYVRVARPMTKTITEVIPPVWRRRSRKRADINNSELPLF